MKKALLISTALVMLSGAASAADLAFKAAPVVAVPMLSSWEGFYVGASAGYSYNRLTDNDVDYWDGLGDNSLITHGFAVGGGLGVNFQRGGLVYGLEGDLSYLSNSRISNGDDAVPTLAPFAQITSKIDALGTLRGRLGIAVDPAFMYITAGLAFGRVNNRYADLESNSGNNIWNDDGWRVGWTAGGGVEVKWDARWSWKIEALYYQLADKTVSYPNPGNGDIYRQRFDDQGLIARLGVNYKW